jgi:hypothetical protein
LLGGGMEDPERDFRNPILNSIEMKSLISEKVLFLCSNSAGAGANF